MDASTRQMLLEGSRITFPPETLVTRERVMVLERARSNCRSRLGYFAGFGPLKDDVFAWKLNIGKERRLSCGYDRDIEVKYTEGVKEKTRVVKLCPLFSKSHDMQYEAEFDEPVLYLTQDGSWLLWITHYKASDPMPYTSEPGHRGIRRERTVHTALSSTIRVIPTQLLDSRHIIKRPEMLGWIITALAKLGEETIEQREQWLGELRDYVREQKTLGTLVGLDMREL